MFRDGLVRLPDAFTIVDFYGHCVLFVHVLIALSPVYLSLFLIYVFCVRFI